VSHIPSHAIRLLFFKPLFGKIGKNNSFLMGVELRNPRNIYIGNNNVFNKRVMLDGRNCKLIVQNNVDIGQEANIWTLTHDVHDDYHLDKGAQVVIEDHAWIGTRSIILPGVTIKRGAVVGAGAVVTRDVESLNIVGGIPAKVIGQRKSNLKYTKFHRPLFQ
jgi:acetyltransferase-like isoleucine patch superfamily enzyme